MNLCSVWVPLCMHHHTLQRMQYQVPYRPSVTHLGVLQLLRAGARPRVWCSVRCYCGVAYMLMHVCSVCMQLRMHQHTLQRMQYRVPH